MTIPRELRSAEAAADAALVERAASTATARWRALEQRIVRLRGNGLTRDQIAERENTPRSVVNLVLQKRGIP